MDPPDVDIPPSLAKVLTAWEERGVRWCILRGARHLAASDGDIDLLVHPEDAARARGIAEEAGFWRVPAWGHGPHRFFLALDDDGRAWRRLDIVDRVVFGRDFELESGCAPAVLARSELRGGLRRPAPDDAFWLLFLHAALDAGRLDERHRSELGELASRSAGVAGSVAEDPAVAPVVRRVGLRPPEAAVAGDWAGLERSIGEARAAVEALGGWRSGLARYRLRLVRRARPVSSLLRRRGLTVTLLGPDGAGKSTLAAMLASTHPLPARTVYAGLYPATARAGSALPGAGFAARVLRMRAAAATAWWHRLRGRLVLVDRHPYDALVAARSGASARDAIRRSVLAKTGPRVDLAVVLDAPADVLLARKQEHPRAFVEKQREAYSRFAAASRRAVLIDASADLETVAASIRTAVWRRHLGTRGPSTTRSEAEVPGN